jgi:hypothetical protein
MWSCLCVRASAPLDMTKLHGVMSVCSCFGTSGYDQTTRRHVCVLVLRHLWIWANYTASCLCVRASAPLYMTKLHGVMSVWSCFGTSGYDQTTRRHVCVLVLRHLWIWPNYTASCLCARASAPLDMTKLHGVMSVCSSFSTFGYDQTTRRQSHKTKIFIITVVYAPQICTV